MHKKNGSKNFLLIPDQSKDDEICGHERSVLWDWQTEARYELLSIGFYIPYSVLQHIHSHLILHLLNKFHIFSEEVYAAREKNGIYIPKDRYLQEEAEKKVLVFSELNVFFI